MDISFYYECGQIREIGTGHHFRSMVLKEELSSRGHRIVESAADVVIVDHMFSQAARICSFRESGSNVVLIDGAEEDVELVDLSISAVCNKKAQFRGKEFVIIPKLNGIERHINSGQNRAFVSMGGFDANNYAERIMDVLNELKIGFLATKSINSNNTNMYNGSNYYLAMKECSIAITNGGLTLFQCLNFGIPTIAIPQYDHQKENIGLVSDFCIQSDIENIKYSLDLVKNKNPGGCIDDFGAKRVCDLIEKRFG